MNLRKQARGQPCTIRILGVCCDTPEHETTVLCHIRGLRQDSVLMQRLAGGAGQKPSDLAAVYGCHKCHDMIDGRSSLPGGHSMSASDKWHYIACALVETRCIQEESRK
jgi:hypothetical protein